MGIDAELLVRTRPGLSTVEVRHLAVDLVEAFWSERFVVIRPDSFWPNGRHALEIVESWEQDGPTIFPDPGEQFIRVNLATRYYGPSYERGDLPSIVMIADWLERRIADAHIWYGGDSSGVLAEPFGKTEREAMIDHFSTHGHRPYSGFGMRSAGDETCSFCAGNKLVACRWGGRGNGYVCGGCDLHRLVHNGVTSEAVGKWPDGVPS